MEPAEDELHAAECRCCFCIEGVAGRGFVPPLLRNAPLDATVKIHAPTRPCRRPADCIASSACWSAPVPAPTSPPPSSVARDLPPSATIVTLLCDRAERYFSTPLFAEVDTS